MHYKEGILYYDPKQGRIDIRYYSGEYHGGLHCGSSIEILVDGKWKKARVEYKEDWYLSGLEKQIEFLGLKARTVEQ